MQDKVLQKLIAAAADRLLSVRREFWSAAADQLLMTDIRLSGKKELLLAEAEERFGAREARWNLVQATA